MISNTADRASGYVSIETTKLVQSLSKQFLLAAKTKSQPDPKSADTL
jgi:hypothetical protein